MAGLMARGCALVAWYAGGVNTKQFSCAIKRESDVKSFGRKARNSLVHAVEARAIAPIPR
jgi:predicted GIY-YIG superfamily endonuclease